jgi:CheY-like chemotaxis protein
MDLSMPHLDGFEATTRILEEAPETAIVVLTGSNDRTTSSGPGRQAQPAT